MCFWDGNSEDNTGSVIVSVDTVPKDNRASFTPAGTRLSVAVMDNTGTVGGYQGTPWEFQSESMNAGALWVGEALELWAPNDVRRHRQRPDPSALERFGGLLLASGIKVVELTAVVQEQATLLGASHQLRTPDTQQAACCRWCNWAVVCRIV